MHAYAHILTLTHTHTRHAMGEIVLARTWGSDAIDTMYSYMYTIYICMHKGIHTYIHQFIHIHIYSYVQINIHTYLYKCTYIRMNMYVNGYI